MSDDKTTLLRIKIDHSQPVELVTLSESMNGLADLFARFADANNLNQNDDPVRLYVTKVTEGSIVIDLQTLASNLVLFVSDVNAISAFFATVTSVFDYVKGKVSENPRLSKKDAEDYSRILGVAAQDNKASIRFQKCNGVTVINNYTIRPRH